MSSYGRIVGSPHVKFIVELSISKGTVHHIMHKNLGLWQSLCTVSAQASVRETEDGENGCLPDQAVSTLKPSTHFLRPGINVSMSMSIISSYTFSHDL
ncbi:hypothetical protein AVEN_83797-1 [Araneus ventricosus]|uniref:Uncharacterized protein n=1 Tax=Araneus ventricosus TaxID=182803 RepID=A0A4Y2WCQ5_ARAVE|nr:hypothetical protein AVEN_83797-1 [Araneus ventricosus]